MPRRTRRDRIHEPARRSETKPPSLHRILMSSSLHAIRNDESFGGDERDLDGADGTQHHAGLAAVPGAWVASAQGLIAPGQSEGPPMKVCIVGASGKLGRYMVQHALDRGYEVVAAFSGAKEVAYSSRVSAAWRNALR